VAAVGVLTQQLEREMLVAQEDSMEAVAAADLGQEMTLADRRQEAQEEMASSSSQPTFDMKQTYVIIADGKVLNTVLWDGDLSSWSPPSGSEAVLLSEIPEATQFPAPKNDFSAIALGEQHVEASGFSAARLVTLFDLLLQAKEAGTLESKPRLVALYTWLQTVKAAAIAGGTEFPAPPFSFEEVVSE
jgi:hypothetical protein